MPENRKSNARFRRNLFIIFGIALLAWLALSIYNALMM
jgi:hypothetical protein